MSDCANVEMRELLPRAGRRDAGAATRARVDEHLVDCADCASELETFAWCVQPRECARLWTCVASSLRCRRRGGSTGLRESQPVKRWMDWRVAAALTTITVGGLSLAVSQRMRQGTECRRVIRLRVGTPPVAPPKSRGG
jgi:hypothetical protein